MTFSSHLRIQHKLTLTAVTENYHGAAFGRGTYALLRGVEQFGSLNKAAHHLGMAYSKAWRLINEAEKQLGVKLAVRQVPHGSTLTPEGHAVMKFYDQICQEVSQLCDERMAEFLSQYHTAQ